jgi:hypothetical protein
MERKQFWIDWRGTSLPLSLSHLIIYTYAIFIHIYVYIDNTKIIYDYILILSPGQICFGNITFAHFAKIRQVS